ncbi:MAG: nicotinate-nucleotide--dimethylbenzimidazole phosphoribosyltransferase, partial [Pontibacterium sp.]
RGIPILVDGVISSVAALYAVRLRPCTRDWMMFAHLSPEPAHKALLAALDAMPLLHMGMRLGEGSGAAIAVDLLRSACELHANMATFEDAGVDNKA